MRGAALVLVAALAACTFPDVDYADDAGTGGAPCPAPASCASDAKSCASQAKNKHKTCTNQCKPSEPQCPGECDDALDDALSVCAASCASCASTECGSSPTNCPTLVGL